MKKIMITLFSLLSLLSLRAEALTELDPSKFYKVSDNQETVE